MQKPFPLFHPGFHPTTKVAHCIDLSLGDHCGSRGGAATVHLSAIPQEFAIIDSQAVDATSLVLKHEASIVDRGSLKVVQRHFGLESPFQRPILRTEGHHQVGVNLVEMQVSCQIHRRHGLDDGIDHEALQNQQTVRGAVDQLSNLRGKDFSSCLKVHRDEISLAGHEKDLVIVDGCNSWDTSAIARIEGPKLYAISSSQLSHTACDGLNVNVLLVVYQRSGTMNL
mmetsp:Transcript_50592/g.103015  ORF Transcript_50592/g.103015 Transcript_50592/m.103015 type:complete len:226 (-) Transcript_50592:270-947(-)